MSGPFYGLRCRPGDLAVIVRDEPECQANIGQLVRVLKVGYEFPDEMGFHWEVQPLSSQPSPILITSRTNKGENRRVEFDTGPRAHLDAWLRPILDEDGEDKADELEEVQPSGKELQAETI